MFEDDRWEAIQDTLGDILGALEGFRQLAEDTGNDQEVMVYLVTSLTHDILQFACEQAGLP